MTLLVCLALLALAGTLLFCGRAFTAWVLPVSLGLGFWWTRVESLPFLWWIAALLFAALVLLFGLPSLRRALVTRHVLRAMAPIFPTMSATERTALEAGTVWWDADLFSGRPRWKKLLKHSGPGLSEREQAFLDREVDEVCAMVDGEVVDQLGDLPAEVWSTLKAKGFMGLIIPQSYGGLGFSAEAISAIVTKVSSHNITLAISVMTPNSLGPAELLLHYGTEAQKERFLPRLARGEELPAFALTEPGAGSDATAMTSSGVVERGEWEGAEVLGVRLNWDKRYITLAPIATLLGMAFKLRDPDHLLGDEESLGITCALVPTHLPGVEQGRRHDPLGIKFLNGPTTGKDVFIPLDHLIGGPAMVGQGWRMIMDCLSAGRSISLPGLACGAAKSTCRALSAYVLIREQFGMPLARFEGVEEALGRIAGKTWLMDAARRMTAQAVASGEKPSVVSAIVKAYLTEGMRDVVNDAMDVQGGAAISRGPRNVLARLYQSIPIGITVEGANILTRTLIIYGQGVIRCHPYAFAEMEAARNDDLKAFDRAFWKHVGFISTNVARTMLLAWTGGRLARAPISGPAAPYFRRLSRLNAAFAVVSDTAMATMGAELKRRERLTGRLADCLAWMYLASASLKRYVDDGQQESDLPFLRWSCDLALHEIQAALHGFIRNMPNRIAAVGLQLMVFPLGKHFHPPTDRLASQVVHAMLGNDESRDRLTAGIYMPPPDSPGLGMLEHGRDLLMAARGPREKLHAAVKAGKLAPAGDLELAREARNRDILSEEEAATVCRALEAQADLIQVDAFDLEAYLARCGA